MSHINEALNKAQKEKDNLSHRYGATISMAQGKDDSKCRRRTILLLAVLVPTLAAAAWTFFLRNDAMPPMKTAVINKATEKAFGPLGPPAAQKAPVGKKTASNTKQVDNLYRNALDLQKEGEIEDAEKLYRKVLNMDEKHFLALNNMGVILMGSGREDEALAFFQKAIQTKKDYCDAYYNMACLHSLKGDLERSLRCLERAVSFNREAVSWAVSDEDLTPLRKMKRFKELRGMN